MTICVIGAIILFGFVLWSSRADNLRVTEIEVQNYAELLAKRLEAALRAADADLLMIQKTLPAAALSVNAVPNYAGEWDSRFDLWLLDYPELGGLRVFDANGELLYTNDRGSVSNANIGDRAHFNATRDSEGAVFSEVLVSRVNGQKMLIISRRLQDVQGRFLGIVTASLDFHYFEKLFQQLDVGDDGITSIYRKDDFRQVLRWPAADQRLNEPLPMDNPIRAAIGDGHHEGVIHITSSIDGVRRIYGYQVLDMYPFFVGAGRSERNALTGWRYRYVLLGLLTVSLLSLLVFQAIQLLRAARLSEVNQRRFKLASEAGKVGVWELDVASGVAWRSGRHARIFGDPSNDVPWSFKRFIEHVAPDDRGRVQELIGKAGALGHLDFECRITRDDNALRWIAVSGDVIQGKHGETERICGTVLDVTDRKQAEERIRRMAFYDPLTNLPNRRLFLDRLTQALASSNRSARYGAVMFMDLDNFKSLNDSSGHEAGDLLLIEVAIRLKSCVREMDTVARFGGDEFVVMLIDLDAGHSEAQRLAGMIAEKISQLLAKPYLLKVKGHAGHESVVEHRCTVSIGYTLFGEHDANIDQIMSCADDAMYQAKAAGSNLIRFLGMKS